MYVRNKIVEFNILILVSFLLLLSILPMKVKAANTYDLKIKDDISYNDHVGSEYELKGKQGYCIQKGIHISDEVDELYNMKIVTEAGDVRLGNYPALLEKNGTIFGGWGTWELKDSSSLSSKKQVSQNKAPSYGRDSIRRGRNFYTEGAIPTYKAKFSQYTPSTNDWSTRSVNALSFIHTFITGTDRDSYIVRQCLTWATEKGYITTSSDSKYDMQLVLKSNLNSFMDSVIGNNKNAQRIYHEFVWKINNLRVLPSFSYSRKVDALANPIHLKWDAKEKAYTATINDKNGVLNYYDFEINGLTCERKKNGLLKITSKKAITSTCVSGSAQNGMLPKSCKFNEVQFYHWVKENGTDYDSDLKESKKFTYTTFEKSGSSYQTKVQQVKASYIDWQDIIITIPEDWTLIDPIYAYIAVTTDTTDASLSETNVKIDLINEDGKIANYIIPGEMYKLRYTYTYTGGSKGFTVAEEQKNIPSFFFPWDTRFSTKSKLSNNPSDSIYNLRTNYRTSNDSATGYKLSLEKTPVIMYGTYTTYETPYTGTSYQWQSDKNQSSFDSKSWDDKLSLDALTTNSDDYKPLSTKNIISSSLHNGNITTCKKSNGILTVSWQYETDYQVFSSAICDATAYMSIGTANNYARTYFDNSYNYAHNNTTNYAGGKGYFEKHDLSTINAENSSYAKDRTIWKTKVDVTASNPVLNTGAGITEAVSKESSQYVNYNLYYTINVANDSAIKTTAKIRKSNGNKEKITKESAKYSVHDVMEFDVNTRINFKASGTENKFLGSLTPIDHVKTGVTYVQRSIPTSLIIILNNKDNMEAEIQPNYDKFIYEDKVEEPKFDDKTGGLSYTLTGLYNNNNQSAKDIIYPAINPKESKPLNIVSTNNLTTFNYRISNGDVVSVSNSNTKVYDEYKVSFNTERKKNKVLFPKERKSILFYKYGNTDYKNGKTILNKNYPEIAPTTGSYVKTKQSQTESYKISKVLFRSNLTKKNCLGINKDGWVDMITDGEHAEVAAGQGFELKVSVTYTNTRLTPYLARYKEFDRLAELASSTGTGKSAQFCNISALTGWKTPSMTTLDKCSFNKVTGSNVYWDLYTYLSDNPNSVYSYSGKHNIPIIYKASEPVTNADGTETTVTYSMELSSENAVDSNYQTMKFYTDALADTNATQHHSIILWTPIIAATGFDYPSKIVDRYLGDAMELTYIIKSSMNDDAISHIVQ